MLDKMKFNVCKDRLNFSKNFFPTLLRYLNIICVKHFKVPTILGMCRNGIFIKLYTCTCIANKEKICPS